MANKKKHAVSNYSKESKSYVSEGLSKEAVNEIFYYLNSKYNIPGWHFELHKSLPMNRFLDRLGIKDETEYKQIVPDGGFIILQNEKNPSIFELVLVVEDKQQESNANAIERFAFHLNFFRNYLRIPILPEVMFFSGNAVKRDAKGIIENKTIRGILKGFISPNMTLDEHSISSESWNMIFMKESQFTEEEKLEILKPVVDKVMSYYIAVI